MAPDQQPDQQPRDDRTVELLLALVVGVLLLAISYFMGHLEVTHVLAAFGLILSISLATAAVLFLATRVMTKRLTSIASSVATETQTRLFRYFTSTALSRSAIDDEPSSQAMAVLSKENVLAIENNATKVWAYAYDLGWDDESDFGTVVRTNLTEGHTYCYLIPDTEEIRATVRGIVCRYQNLPNLETQLLFRVRPHEVPFARFALSIYNPKYLQPIEHDTSDSVVVLFPHFAHGVGTTYPFIRLSGHVVGEYEREFRTLWDQSQPLDVQQILRECHESESVK